MISAAQIAAHLVGDYLIQSHWMATEKTRRHLPAAVHALSYGVPFLVLRPSPAAMAVIVGTHFVIDRWRLARFACWAKNQVGPRSARPAEVGTTGYPADTPVWLAVWLLIIADNTLHILINAVALEWL